MKVRWFASGYVVGLVTALAFTALAARMVGGDGYLSGWTVTIGGEDVCHDPFVWTGTREIEC